MLPRLFPTAYPDDEEAAGDFRRYTEGDLRDGKAAAAAAVIDTLEEAGLPAEPEDGLFIDVELDGQTAATWLRSFTDMRLALATRLGVEDDDEDVLAGAARRRPARAGARHLRVGRLPPGDPGPGPVTTAPRDVPVRVSADWGTLLGWAGDDEPSARTTWGDHAPNHRCSVALCRRAGRRGAVALRGERDAAGGRGPGPQPARGRAGPRRGPGVVLARQGVDEGPRQRGRPSGPARVDASLVLARLAAAYPRLEGKDRRAARQILPGPRTRRTATSTGA